MPMLLIEKGPPLLLRVTLRVGAVVPTGTLPKEIWIGSTVGARSTVSHIDCAMPLAVAVIFALCVLSTTLVATSKLADLAACGTEILAATGYARAGLLLSSFTVMGPGPAWHSSVASPIALRPPTTLGVAKVSEARPIGRTVSCLVSVVLPSVARTVPVSGAVTGVVVIVKVPREAPAGMRSVSGVLADRRVSLRLTTTPADGAGRGSNTVPVTVLQPATVVWVRKSNAWV